MSHIIFNGKQFQSGQAVLQADNKSYRYGDGLFETMKVFRGRIIFEDQHMERWFRGLALLGMELPVLVDRKKLVSQILALCLKNDALVCGRVRLSAFRGNGGLLEGDDEAGYIIEAWPLAETIHQWNENGLKLGIYPDARKTIDVFSGLKLASFHPYPMAARYAKANRLNDCLVLNTNGSVCDSTIASVFLVKDGVFITPGLDQGCVDGIMRKTILAYMADHGLKVEEKAVSLTDLEEASEVFLTNVVRGIRWVQGVGNKSYSSQLTYKLHQDLAQYLLT